MNRRIVPILVALALAACQADDPGTEDGPPVTERAPPVTERAPPVTERADARPGALTPDGWGPLRIGMSRAEVEAVAGEDAHPDRVGGVEPDVCDEFRPAGAPEHMLLMIRDGTLSRITIMRESEVRTERGFGIGDSGAAILAAYGAEAEWSPHKYRDAPSAYITAWTVPPGGAAPARGIVYDIGNDGLVGLVHAGDDSITYVEGCL